MYTGKIQSTTSLLILNRPLVINTVKILEISIIFVGIKTNVKINIRTFWVTISFSVISFLPIKREVNPKKKE